jgi:tetratricopeptide (TPR) repeat protein
LARQYLEQATARDPRFAAAHAALGEAYVRFALYEPEVRANAWAAAEASAKRALALDETLPAGHVTLAAIRLYRDWDWRSARSEYQRAIDLDAGDSGARTGYAVYLRAAGRMGEAIAQLRKALETDPLNVPLATLLAGDYLLARKYDDAIREFQRALELEPEYWPAVRELADAYERKGLDEQALAQTMKLFTGRGPKELTEFERVCRSQGYQAAARWLDRKQIEQYSRNADANAYNLAFSYARLGDKDNAFRFLEAAYRLRDANLLQLRVDPDMDGLRSDPRYADLLRRMGAMP